MQYAATRQSNGFQPNAAGFVRRVGHGVGRVLIAMVVARERRKLMELDDRMLKDIGIGRSEAYAEASKPFGDIPWERLRRYY